MEQNYRPKGKHIFQAEIFPTIWAVKNLIDIN